jgi:hypothetical protein
MKIHLNYKFKSFQIDKHEPQIYIKHDSNNMVCIVDVWI